VGDEQYCGSLRAGFTVSNMLQGKPLTTETCFTSILANEVLVIATEL